MSDKAKINIEKRIFNLGQNEKFILEYPSNYNEITEQKLSNLQKEYDYANSNKNIINTNSEKYYQRIDEEKKEDEEQNKEIKLEPQEGFIEIKKKNTNININENINKENDDDDEINSDDFYEVEEKENKEKNNNKNIFNNNKVNNINNDIEEKKRSISPVGNRENVISSMKKLNFKAPKWAENMTDNDFINMARNKIFPK